MYATPAQLMQSVNKATLIQLSNDESPAVDVNVGVIDMALQFAVERIDAALRGRYRLPLSQTPTLIHQLCLTLARYWLYSRRPETKLPENVKETYQQAIKELEHIALGKLHLGLAEVADRSADSELGDLLPDAGEFVVKSPKGVDVTGY